MRILAVDDEPLALRSLEGAICAACPDADVVCCSSARTALDEARTESFDVAFLDIEMGSLGGLELARHLRRSGKGPNVVFVTAYSQYALEAFAVHASGYLLKPVEPEAIVAELENLGVSCEGYSTGRVLIRTFGNFEVLCDGRPVAFPRSKAKELLAYLVHKRGGTCTVRELASVLFEDREYTLSVQRQMQTIIATMMKTLREIGVENLVTKDFNSLAVNVDVVDCDYYRFFAGDMESVNSYVGEYMANYSWAEFVVGYLDGRVRRD